MQALVFFWDRGRDAPGLVIPQVTLTCDMLTVATQKAFISTTITNRNNKPKQKDSWRNIGTFKQYGGRGMVSIIFFM